jgi:hypothetical protein
MLVFICLIFNKISSEMEQKKQTTTADPQSNIEASMTASAPALKVMYE